MTLITVITIITVLTVKRLWQIMEAGYIRMNGEGQPTERQQFIEELGLFFEKRGLPRMAGRILGHLLICNPPEQSTVQLADALVASRASMSSMTRLLMHFGLVEQVNLPGRRQSYFRISPTAWDSLMRQSMDKIVSLRQLGERGLEILDDSDPRLRQRLEGMCRMYEFFEREFSAIWERWQEVGQEDVGDDV